MQIQLDDWQKDFINTKGDKILCCGRQVGKTEICAHDCGEYVQKPDNPHPVLMTAPTERQAYNLFDKTLQYLLENYPKSIILKGTKRPTKSKIELRNGMRIYCLPTGVTGLGIRGITVGRSYEDENSRVADEIESAIAPMLLITGGARIKLSTPFGARGEFWRTYINKDMAYDSYKRFEIDSETVIREREICATWTEKQREGALRLIEQSKARMSNKEFAQEWLGHFIEDLFRFFSDDIIRKTCILKRRPAIIPNRNYYMGVDIARMGEDKGAIEILDKINDKNIEQVENIVTQKQLTTQTEQNIINSNNRYNCRKIGLDAGAGTLGVSVLDHLLKHPIIRKIVVALNNAKRIIDREGRGVKLLKEDMYQNMLSMMEHGTLKLLDDDNIMENLQAVQYEYTMEKGQPAKIRIFGSPTDIVEGLTRACQLANQKSLNISVSWI